MKRIVLLYVFILLSSFVFSQHKISGRVTDNNGVPLSGANIVIDELKTGTTSSENGQYRIQNLPRGNYTIVISFLGYSEIRETIKIPTNTEFDITLKTKPVSGEEIIVYATRAGVNTPTTYSEVDKETLRKQNLGQDIPFLLSMEPSLIATSDAGAGIGYTGLWIRGSNIQRINVTVNGVPLNDPESHSVFWVNMPDFASSVESAQIQRGVGTSTNGGGAFGATINLETNFLSEESFGEINSSYGSFGTWRNNARFGTGIINDKWAFDGRLSKITSDGYIDRASSDLSSFFIQGGYHSKNTTVKGVVFSGSEKTYQAWWGVDESTMNELGRTFNWAGAIFNEDGSIGFYDNQEDNYQQDHYQLHWSQKINEKMNFNTALHYTYGRGYYEEYYQQDFLGNYPIGVQYFGFDSVLVDGKYNYFYRDSVSHTDLIARRWLDNQFFGGTYAFYYSTDNISLTVGGAFNKYANARHFGEIIWSRFSGNTNIRDKFYDNTSNKTELNSFVKINYTPVYQIRLFADLQVRNINYSAEGIDKGSSLIHIDEPYTFFNPKFGAIYSIPAIGVIYASVALANREPIRTDFLDAPEGKTPEPEKLWDYELGLRHRRENYFYNLNGYFMKYLDQLVLTGEINDVGSPVRENVGKSFRTGIEIDGGVQATRWFRIRANTSAGTSNTDYKRIEDSVIVDYNNVQLSFSPRIIAGLELTFNPIKNLDITGTTKFVSGQYLDLTKNKEKSLDPYSYTNIRIGYSFSPVFIKEINLSLLINNVFNAMYSSNGYIWGETPYYYPQAGINFLGGISLKF